jgi:NAD-dependent dihydropyrimidine dehydrogenase PreA subunit
MPPLELRSPPPNASAQPLGRAALGATAFSADAEPPRTRQNPVNRKSTRLAHRVVQLQQDDSELTGHAAAERAALRAQRSGPLDFVSAIDVFDASKVHVDVVQETHERIVVALHHFDQPMVQALRRAVAHVKTMTIASVAVSQNNTVHSASAIEAQLLTLPLDLDARLYTDDREDGGDFARAHEVRARGRAAAPAGAAPALVRDPRFRTRLGLEEDAWRAAVDAPMTAHIVARAEGVAPVIVDGDGIELPDESVFECNRRFPERFLTTQHLVSVSTRQSEPLPLAPRLAAIADDSASEARSATLSTAHHHLADLDDEAGDEAALAEWRARREAAAPAAYRRPHERPARIALLRPPEALVPTTTHPRAEAAGSAPLTTTPAVVLFATATKRSAGTHDNYAAAAAACSFSTINRWARLPPIAQHEGEDDDLVEPSTHDFLVSEDGRRADGVKRASQFDARAIAASCDRGVFQLVPSLTSPDIEDLMVVAPEECHECGRCAEADLTGSLFYRPDGDGAAHWFMVQSRGMYSAAHIFVAAFRWIVTQTTESWALLSGEKVDVPYVRDPANPVTLDEFHHLGGPLAYEVTHKNLRAAYLAAIEPDDAWCRAYSHVKAMYSQR